MTETKAECPECEVMAYVDYQQGARIKMKCPQCKKHWWTESKRCTSCGKVTGFAVPGLCSDCYSRR